MVSDKNGEGCGERVKEKERERRALLSLLSWSVSFEILRLDTVRLWNEGFPPFLCATVWCSQF